MSLVEIAEKLYNDRKLMKGPFNEKETENLLTLFYNAIQVLKNQQEGKCKCQNLKK